MTAAMDQLTVHTREDGDKFLCVWKVGRKQGMVFVSVEVDVPEKAVVAELSAIHYLVEDVQLLGDNRSGANLALTVSSSLIADIKTGKSQRSHLVPFAALLTTKFLDVPTSVNRDDSWVGEGAGTRVKHLVVTEPMRVLLDVKGHGTIGVTKHGFDQFRTRLNNVGAVDAWKEMQRIAKVGMVSTREYHRGSRKLFHAESHWAFIVGEDGNLITAYSDLNAGKHVQQETDTRALR